MQLLTLSGHTQFLIFYHLFSKTDFFYIIELRKCLFKQGKIYKKKLAEIIKDAEHLQHICGTCPQGVKV